MLDQPITIKFQQYHNVIYLHVFLYLYKRFWSKNVNDHKDDKKMSPSDGFFQGNIP